MNMFLTAAEAIAATEATAVAANANAAPAAPVEAKKFVVGQQYSTRSICNHDCIMTWEIVKRTEKSVWVRSVYNGKPEGEVSRKSISTRYDDADCELIYPAGRYSMCPVIDATDTVVKG